MDIQTIKTVYFIGIKGVGMSGLAVIAKERGMNVLGSDISDQFITDSLLDKHSISPLLGFSVENIQKYLSGKIQTEVLVIVTAAHGGMGNIEAQEAQKMGLYVMSYGKALSLFMQGKRAISIAGTHGKTTTTALLSHVLVKDGLDPSFLIGTSNVASLSQPAHSGKGDIFIAEADEYVSDPVYDKTPKFLYQHPEIGIITTIDWDHPDVYPNLEAVKISFSKFINNISNEGVLIANADDACVTSLISKTDKNVITYGFSENSNLHITEETSDITHSFKLTYNKRDLGTFSTKLLGKHNSSNIAAVVVTALHLDIDSEKIKTYISSFIGSQRRMELKGNVNGVTLFDDYAHHPREIETTIRGLKDTFKDRNIIVIFQPHTYSRTRALFSEFSTSFVQADSIYITDIFASSREKNDVSMTSEMLVNEIQEKGKLAEYVQNVEEFLVKYRPNMKQNDILITMGAGNIYTWGDKIIKELT